MKKVTFPTEYTVTSQGFLDTESTDNTEKEKKEEEADRRGNEKNVLAWTLPAQLAKCS